MKQLFNSAIRSKLVPGAGAELGFSCWLQHDSKVTGRALAPPKGRWGAENLLLGQDLQTPPRVGTLGVITHAPVH